MKSKQIRKLRGIKIMFMVYLTTLSPTVKCDDLLIKNWNGYGEKRWSDNFRYQRGI